MAHQVAWTKVIVEEFIRIGRLTKLEEMVLRTRAAGWTRTKQHIKFNVSVSTIDRTIATLKQKYDVCQQYSPILPPRKTSKEEDYMDTH